MSAAAAITIVTHDGTARVIELSRPITLGRSSASELSYPEDSGLSRQHLIIEPTGAGWAVRDLGSKNGTKVNSVRITDPHLLRPGDQIAAGHLLIRFGDGVPTREDHTVLFVPEPRSASSSTIAVKLDRASDTLAGAKSVQALIRAGQELSSHRPLSELFTLILHLATEAVGAARAVLLTLENGNLEVRAAEGDRFEISTTVRDRVLNEKTSLLVSDALGDSILGGKQSIVLQGVRSVMAVPLQTNDRVIGLLYVDTQDMLRPFSEEDLSLLTVMANVAAIRIEQARLAEVEQAERVMAQELANAADIQRGFLPSASPRLLGLDLDGRNIPCRTVGGDYFDYFLHDDGTVSLIVADVAGKGMPAALMMSNMQAHTQALMEAGMSPAWVLQRLNKAISARCPGNRFITCFLARIDPSTGRIAYCNAGHNPPLLVRTDGTAEALGEGGMILGILAAASYGDHFAEMHPGDVLALYSDGVTEACKAGSEEEFGEARLAELIHRARRMSASQIVQGAIAELTAWTAPAPFADDVTLIIARRTA